MKIKKILLIIAIFVSVFGSFTLYKQSKKSNTVKAYGNLLVDFHSILPGNTIFDINNFLPGQSISKTIDVKNEGNNTEVLVRGVKKSANITPKIESVLDLVIKQGSTTLYSDKLVNFLGGNKVSLGLVNKNQTKTYIFLITFSNTAGNEFQNKNIKFDLDFSSKGDVKGDHDEHTPKPSPKPTPTQKPRHDNDHDDHNNNHKRDFKDDLKDFGDRCKSAIENLFKGRQR